MKKFFYSLVVIGLILSASSGATLASTSTETQQGHPILPPV